MRNMLTLSLSTVAAGMVTLLATARPAEAADSSGEEVNWCWNYNSTGGWVHYRAGMGECTFMTHWEIQEGKCDYHPTTYFIFCEA